MNKNQLYLYTSTRVTYQAMSSMNRSTMNGFYNAHLININCTAHQKRFLSSKYVSSKCIKSHRASEILQRKHFALATDSIYNKIEMCLNSFQWWGNSYNLSFGPKYSRCFLAYHRGTNRKCYSVWTRKRV